MAVCLPTLNDNAKTNLTEFTRRVKMGFIDLLGGKVLPKVTEWSASLNQNLGPALSMVGDVLADVTGFLGDHQTVAIGLVGIIGALTAVTYAHAAAMAVSAAGGMASWLAQTKVITGATKVWAAVQWALNGAMSDNPIMLVVLGVAALVAIIVVAWKHSETFRKIVTGAFNGVKDAAAAAFGWVKRNWPLLLGIVTGPFGLAASVVARHWGTIKSGATDAYRWVTGKLGALRDFVAGMPGKITKAASGMFDGIKDAFRSAINFMIRGWNDLEFKIPGVKVPGPLPDIPGFTLGTPNIPELATGGRVDQGGRLVRIGEREPETVLRDRDILKLLTKARDAADRGPLIDKVVQQPNEDPHVFAERLWLLLSTRG